MPTIAQKVIQEIIGFVRPVSLRFRRREITSFRPTYDFGQEDYAFWDRARQCLISGLELSGVFIKIISSKVTSYVLGRRPHIYVGDDYTDEYANNWLESNYGLIEDTYDEGRQLGDIYIVVNPDQSLTMLQPDIVVPIVDENDLSRFIGWRLEQVYQHPTNPERRQTVIDEYYVDRRVKTVDDVVTVFPNLIGKIPLHHIPINRKSNERFGRPDCKPLLPLLNEYNEILIAGINGNKRQGRPTPTISKVGDAGAIARFQEMYGTQKRETNKDGTVSTYWEYDFDPDQLLILGGDAEFEYASPNLFVADTEKLLGLMFYLLVQYSEIPEYAYGNAIASSKASAEAQVDPFVRYIERQQNNAEVWIKDLIDTVLRYAALSDRKIKLGRIGVDWSDVIKNDITILNALRLAMEVNGGVIDELTFLEQLPLDIRDKEAVLKKAKREREERAEELLQQQQFELSGRNLPDVGEDEATPDSE